MTFIDLIKNAIFEEEPQGKQPLRPAPAASSMAAPAPARMSAMSSISASDVSDNKFYGRLVKQTDLSAVPELAKIASFAAPLAAAIQDTSLRDTAPRAAAQPRAGVT